MNEEEQDKEIVDKELIETWFTRAREVKNLDDLNTLMKEMMAYEHDYGTIVHACVAAALGATWCMDKSPQGGLTGFQAGFIGSHFMGKWLHIEGPWKRTEFKNMLFPQYEDNFEKTLSPETFEWLQTEAKKNLAELDSKDTDEERKVELKKHWTNIAEGIPPFGYTVKED